jgi:pyruvate,water dikinase
MILGNISNGTRVDETNQVYDMTTQITSVQELSVGGSSRRLEKVWSEVYGGKASGLLRIYQLGFRIPETILVPSGADVNDILKGVERLRPPIGVDEERLWAVRSSGRGEDGEEMSYAGQHLTELNVKLEDVPAAIVRCRESEVWSKEYVEAVSGGAGEKGMCVVVQEMIQAKYAGVLFTADPETGRRDVSVLEFVNGLGEGLVSGTEMPAGSFKVVSKLYPTWDSNWFIGLADVMHIGVRLGHFWDTPLDIEWAIDDRGLTYVLQARPLTALPPEPKAQTIAVNTGAVVEGVVGRIPGPVFKKGQVLVTEMTNPRMINAMLKAKAIVTEIGGRTCHAAVVSRELGLPCLVGYEPAKDLDNGDVVEVDTMEREVRKVG